MAETNAQIDVSDKDKRDESAGTAPVTIKGTKKAVAAAKSAIMAISSAVDDETTVTVQIEPKFHRTIIGGGGAGLKNLLARVGAPSEQAGLVRLYVIFSLTFSHKLNYVVVPKVVMRLRFVVSGPSLRRSKRSLRGSSLACASEWFLVL
jgi:hypothetical protein